MFLVAFDLFVVCPAVVVGVAEKYDKIGASFCFCAQLPVPLNCYVLLQHLAKKQKSCVFSVTDQRRRCASVNTHVD